ncbi:hypothetical protein AVEN_138454-1 [Araneus ventricosus]|uniref:Uncharacterized protein n=1 Tax=Araneus ventricosus TaxID=182803 RepID=A0A4Y2CEV5_ARAVE|nr:hypothetical protein AVEN_138454-1 [Araneus ventricosus]
MTKERKARWLARQSQESLDRIHAVDAAAYRRRIEAETQAREKEMQPLIVAASKDILPIKLKLKLAVEIFTNTSDV